MPLLPEFRSPRLVLARGRSHIDELRTKISVFSSSAKIDQKTVFDVWRSEYIVKMVFSDEIPYEFSVIAKDAISNLRDSLDQAVYASARALKGGDPKKTKFLVGSNEQDLRNEAKGKKYSDVPSEIMDLMWTFRPYGGGNPLLAPLNLSRNENTHRLLVPILYKRGGIELTLSSIPANGFKLIHMGGAEQWDEDRRELVLARLGTPPTEELKLSAELDIVFGGSDTTGKQSATNFLDAAATEVEGIISSIEAETVRILSARLAES